MATLDSAIVFRGLRDILTELFDGPQQTIDARAAWAGSFAVTGALASAAHIAYHLAAMRHLVAPATTS